MSFLELLDLFGLAFAAALISGLVCPLIGCFLLLRRTGFYGVALPQFAASGVAAGFAAIPLLTSLGLGGPDLESALLDEHQALNYHLTWAALFTFGGLGALAALGRRGGSEVARVAALFSIATAGTILFASASPVGETFVRDRLLRGEILAVGIHELETIGAVMGLTLLTIVWGYRDLLIVSFDPETARVLGKRVGRWELLLHAITGLCVAAGTMTVGPVVLFGLLVLPPLAARGLARSMRGMLLWAAVLGLISAALGIWASFHFDWPLGPAVVVTAALPLPIGWLADRSR